MKLSPELESCVIHFGEMAGRWGFNRSVGQVLALTVFTEEPLCADDICELLTMSRGNVSMAIKELHSWQLIQIHRLPNDRKDYYSAKGSLWDMALQVMSERRKREVDPTLSMLRKQILDNDQEESPNYTQQKIQEIHDLLELLTRWLNDVQNIKPEHLQTLIKLGAGIGKALSFTSKKE